MENNFNIAKFDKQKAELNELVKNCKSVVINGVNDKVGYALVDESRKILKKKRCDLQRDFKAERAISNAYSKAVITLEKEVIEIIEPLEIELKEKQDKIDWEKEKIKRKEFLPEKIGRLKTIEAELGEDEILEMSDKTFDEFFNNEKSEYLAEKERKIKVAEEKLANDKMVEEEKKKAREDERQQAKLDAEQAKIDAEREKKEAVDKVKREAEQEKQKIIDDQKRKDDEAKEAKERIEREAKLAPDKEKLASYAITLAKISVPNLKSEQAIIAMTKAQNKLKEVIILLDFK